MELLHKLREILETIASEYDIKYAVLFGSYAIGEEKPYSDIDVAVKFDVNKSSTDCIYDSGKISDILSSELDKMVNIVSINVADTLLKYEIFSKHIILYVKDKNMYLDDRLNAIDEYLDFKEHFEQHYNRIVREIKGRM